MPNPGSGVVDVTLDTDANILNPAIYPPARYPGQKFAATDKPHTYTSNGTVMVPEYGGASLGKYWVNNSPVAPGQQPVAPFSDLQAAIDGAFADGHGPSNPTAVYVMPGALSQAGGASLVMRAGIDVIGLGGVQQAVGGAVSDVQFTGNVVVDMADGTASTIQGMSVVGKLIMTGSGRYVFGVLSSQFIPTNGDACTYFNSGGALPVFQNSQFVSSAGGGRGMDLSVSAQIFASDTVFTGNGAGNAIALAWHNGQQFVRCTFNGVVNGSSALGSGTAEFDDCVFNPTATAVMQVAAGATAKVMRGRITGTPTDPFITAAGAGAQLIAQDIVDPSGTHVSISTSNLGTVPSYTLRVWSESTIVGGSPFTIPALAMTDLIECSQTGAWTANLPPIASVISGIRSTITNNHATAGACTVQPNGTDTVNGGAPGVAYVTASNCRSIELQPKNNGGPTDWRIVNISPL